MIGVYLAGPYSNPETVGVFRNVGRGIKFASALLLEGYAPYCPFIDFHYILVEEDKGKRIEIENLYNLSLHWLSKSDVLLCPFFDWDKSKGTRAEIKVAHSLKIPVLYDEQSFHEMFPVGRGKVVQYEEWKSAVSESQFGPDNPF